MSPGRRAERGIGDEIRKSQAQVSGSSPLVNPPISAKYSKSGHSNAAQGAGKVWRRSNLRCRGSSKSRMTRKRWIRSNDDRVKQRSEMNYISGLVPLPCRSDPANNRLNHCRVTRLVACRCHQSA